MSDMNSLRLAQKWQQHAADGMTAARESHDPERLLYWQRVQADSFRIIQHRMVALRLTSPH